MLTSLCPPLSTDEVFGFIAAPVITAEEEVQGVMLVFNKSNPDEAFTDNDVFSIEQISRFASNAFKTWESIYQAQYAKQRMETLVGMIKVRGEEERGEERRLERSDSISIIPTDYITNPRMSPFTRRFAPRPAHHSISPTRLTQTW